MVGGSSAGTTEEKDVDPIGGYGHSLDDFPRDACQLDGR
jgi:hypothetical protein